MPEQGWKYAGIELQLLNCGVDEDAVIVSRTEDDDHKQEG